jgi:polysaccharide biosynthesis protein PelF
MTKRLDGDVCLVLEGTYPYVPGGVSSWVHEILRRLPEQTFSLVHIGPCRGSYGPPRYELPPNVVGMIEHYLQAERRVLEPKEREQLRKEIEKRIRGARKRPNNGSRTLDAFRRLQLDEKIDVALIDDLAQADCTVDELLHGDEAFAMISEVYRACAPTAPFLDFFWSFRSMHVPLLTLLLAEIPRARTYHSISTGYAGVLAAVASRRTGRPMLLTEHGIYAREREIELARASWITERSVDPRVPVQTISPLRRFWIRFFQRLSQIAYLQASSIVTLSQANRTKQLADGAAADRTSIIPNGVDTQRLVANMGERSPRVAGAPLRVGFVGRVVPIKDVVTLIKAVDLALAEVRLAVEVIGPTEEDPAYAARCRELVATLGREDEIRFVGPRPLAQIYRDLDIVVLTSFSEGQPLVILEAHAAAVPVIATDVGACREMLEGTEQDAHLGPSGIVTRVAAPEETAAALVRLAREPALLRRMGEAGKARVEASYTEAAMLGSYRSLYDRLVA